MKNNFKSICSLVLISFIYSLSVKAEGIVLATIRSGNNGVPWVEQFCMTATGHECSKSGINELQNISKLGCLKKEALIAMCRVVPTADLDAVGGRLYFTQLGFKITATEVVEGRPDFTSVYFTE